jgi:hypothetical protein
MPKSPERSAYKPNLTFAVHAGSDGRANYKPFAYNASFRKTAE